MFNNVFQRHVFNKQFTYTLLSMRLPCRFQGALKLSPFEPDDMFYLKQRLAELSLLSLSLSLLCYMFYLSFLLRMFFKTVGEPLHLLTVHRKLVFRGALKKALSVPEDRSHHYTLQKFSLVHQHSRYKFIFTFIFRNHLRMHFEYSQLSKVKPLVNPKVHPKLLWKLPTLRYFSKT